MSVAVVVGAGPGLGMAIAHRFGREGHDVALISRTDTRHAGYVAELARAGVTAEAFTADVRDRDQLLAALDRVGGEVEVLYYGPGAADEDAPMKSITEITAADAERALTWLYPAVDAVGHVLPGMLGRGGGALLFAGGLSSVVPMPGLGALALNAAALRNYAVTLNAALADKGIYAGTLTIGGLVERGDIHRMLTADPARYGRIPTLNPDDIAETAWRLTADRDRAEAVFNALG
ncbi:SDR family NAD(P)-dependent oxidoreductase [Nocardia sp. NRRL S-836]|uniref:SDR family NAD(P)-dependent oxidoreductase n=1 Tax=Nocardia sp. NRRL S-836 TaxID=1519492 RepID=UPI0006B04A41|nr:SDR family NAD(P)-dependent oxidoreductase [Nocardia sp. NRRL S-836]KOV81454.1 short-chain dehydrogenase [Nocardia sp. NRRL S-836]